MDVRKEFFVTKLIVHYIYSFPLIIGLILVYGVPPQKFEWEGKKEIFFWSFVGVSFLATWAGRWLRAKGMGQWRDVRMYALLCAATGELCLILGIVYGLLTGDFRQTPVFALFWGVHYVSTVLWLRQVRAKWESAAPTPPEG